jgi:hypothetical protein
LNQRFHVCFPPIAVVFSISLGLTGNFGTAIIFLPSGSLGVHKNTFTNLSESKSTIPFADRPFVGKEFQSVLESGSIRPKEYPYYHRWADSWL